MSTRRTISKEQKLEWGKIFHEGLEAGTLTRKASASELGISESQLDTYHAMYLDSAGLDNPKAFALRPGKRGGLTEAERKARDAARHKANRAAKKAAAAGQALAPIANGNGTGKHLALVEHDSVLKLKDRIRTLEAELAHVTGEAHTLQKIVMVLGERL